MRTSTDIAKIGSKRWHQEADLPVTLTLQDQLASAGGRIDSKINVLDLVT